MTETVVHLKPRDQWRAGVTLDQLRAEMGRAAELPGVTNIWTMPIINRIDMLTTGVRSEIGVKIYGTDLAVLDETARRVAAVLRTVPGAANVYPEPLTGAQYLNVRIDREKAARYGLTVAAVQDVIETAVGERVVTRTLEGRRRFPVRVRYAAEYRDEVQALGNVLIAASSGEQVPLGQVASFEQVRGAAMITSENGLLLATVLLNVQGRDVGGFVDEAQGCCRRRRGAASRATSSGGAASSRTRSARASGSRFSCLSSSSSSSGCCTSPITQPSRRRTCCWPSPLRSQAASTCSGCWTITFPSPSGSVLSRSSGRPSRRRS